MSKKPLVLAANADSHRQFKEIELTDPCLSSVSGALHCQKVTVGANTARTQKPKNKFGTTTHNRMS